jgi:AraC family transcriptional regulator
VRVIEGLNAALVRLEDQIEGDVDIDMEELARLAATSTYHLRRMFSSLAGMSLSTYVRRRRMTLAAAEIRAGRTGLLEIAVRFGYGSTEAFARAFREVHGAPPRAARDDSVELVTQPRLQFRLTIEGDTPMRHRIVDKDAFGIVGRRRTVPLIYEGVNPHITEFIAELPEDLHGRLQALSDQEPSGILAVTYVRDPDRPEGSDVDYYHAVATSRPVPDDLDHLAVPAATWAVFEVSGPFHDALQRLWADTAAVWFPSNPYRAVHAPELLKIRVSEDQAPADCQLWIMVEPDPGR